MSTYPKIEIKRVTTNLEVDAPPGHEVDIYRMGPPGPQGDPGVEVGDTPPENTAVIWVDTSA